MRHASRQAVFYRSRNICNIVSKPQAAMTIIVLHRNAYKKRNPWQFFARSCGKT